MAGVTQERTAMICFSTYNLKKYSARHETHTCTFQSIASLFIL